MYHQREFGLIMTGSEVIRRTLGMPIHIEKQGFKVYVKCIVRGMFKRHIASLRVTQDY